MRRLLLSSFVSAALWAAPALADTAPAGYIVAIEPATGGTAVVVRGGKELTPKLLMPLYDGDAIDLKGSNDRIAFERGGGTVETIDGSASRVDITGELPTGDDAASIFSAIGDILSGDSAEIPDNMVSKGLPPDFRMPLSVRGLNHIVTDHDTLWLGWIGGKPAYVLSSAVKQGGAKTEVARTEEREAEVAVPDAKRFMIDVVDDNNQGFRVFFRRMDALPELPANLKSAAPGPTAELLLTATWLASLDDGQWRVEAAQLLRREAKTNRAAAELLDRLVDGWKP